MSSGQKMRERDASRGGLGATSEDPNQATTPSSTRLQNAQEGESSTSKPKRHQIAMACNSCRDSKLRCSGNHPTCDRCASRGLNCIYDVDEEGVTRREHLRRQYEEQKSELDRAHAVLAFLQGCSDHEAAQCLARLRIGYTVDDVYQMLGSITFTLDSGQLSPEAARVATQLGQALPQTQQAEASGATQRGWQVDGVPQMSRGSQDLQVPSVHSSPHSPDGGLPTSAAATSPTSPMSDTLDPALWPEGLSQRVSGSHRGDASGSAR